MSRPLSRRSVLRGAGVAVALPFLDIMRPPRALAQAAPKNFIGFYVPNGTDPRVWQGAPGPLRGDSLPPALVDMNGFAAEGEWPAGNAYFQDVTLVTNTDHTHCTSIHSPSMAFCAAGEGTRPAEATLDQRIADAISEGAPYRNLVLSADGDTAVEQGFISWRSGEQSESVERNVTSVFDRLFSNFTPTSGQAAPNMDAIRKRRMSVLDWVLDDASRLRARLGVADQRRIDQHLQAIRELELQITAAGSSGAGLDGAACSMPGEPGGGLDKHGTFKLMIDLGLLAVGCGLTRVLMLQYSNCWNLEWSKYDLPDGVANWSDHFVSHKLGDRDRATDLDGLDQGQAMAIANARVLQTSRIKVRRFGYLIDRMKAMPSASGNLLDESLVMYTSEIGDGDSHGRMDLPYMLAGHVGGFQTGRSVHGNGAKTLAVHDAILGYFGIAARGTPLAGL